MNKKIDNVLCFGEHTLSNEQKHFQKYFLYIIIIHRNPFVKVFVRIFFDRRILLWKKEKK